MFFESLHESITLLADKTPLGPAILCCYGASLLASFALVPVGVSARGAVYSRAFSRLSAFVVVTFALGAAASFRVVQQAHQWILDPATHPPQPPHSKFYSAFLEGLVTSDSAWVVSMSALTAISAFFLVAVVLRKGRHSVFAGLVSVLCLATGCALFWARHVATLTSFCGDPQGRCEALTTMTAESIQATNLARLGIVVLVVVGSVVVVWAERKNRSEADRLDEEAVLARGAAVFAFGLAAFFGSRAMAYDARHRIPLREKNEAECPSLSSTPNEDDARTLPAAALCNASCDGPTVFVESGRFSVDGQSLETTEDLETILQGKRKLSLAINGPNRTLPPLLIAADAKTSTATLEPVIASARRAFGGEIAVVGVHPEKHIKTATVGDVRLLPRCCCTKLVEDSQGKKLGSFATWGDVARASGAGEVFSFAP